MRGSAPHAPQGRAGLRSASVIAKPTSTGRRATLTGYNKQTYVLLVFFIVNPTKPSIFYAGLCIENHPAMAQCS